MLVEIEEQVSFSPLAISCIFKAVKDYFTPDELQSLLDVVEKQLKKSSQSDSAAPCIKFAHEEMAKDIKLSLAVD